MNASDQEKHFLEKARNLLNEGVENLDRQTCQSLQNIRIGALRAMEKSRSGLLVSFRWIMVGGFATATVAAVALFFWLSTSPENLPAKQAEDFEIITSQEKIDFYQNLDFYRWLVTEENGPRRENRSNI
jgi:hypothetical protein